MEVGLMGLERAEGRRSKSERGENVETESQFDSGKKKSHKNSEKFSENPDVLALAGILICVSLLHTKSQNGRGWKEPLGII